jgi:isoleucyl-tRNA synthetase
MDNEKNEKIKNSMLLPKTKFPLKNTNHSVIEKEIRDFWKKENVYQKKLEKNSSKKKFILHSGPTYANGKIHVGHVLNYVLKDIIVRYFSDEFYSPFLLG